MINNITVLDNFYSDPSSVTSMLDGDYPIFGCGTGKRSVGLHEINPQMCDNFWDGICRAHGITNTNNLYFTTFFMEHTYNPIEIFNYGWVHIDGKNPDACRMTTDEYKLVLCGQIFLTPNPDPETGVSICDLKPSVKWSPQELIDKTVNDYTIPREEYEAGNLSLDDYTKQHQSYHDNFTETCFVKNKYNRMVSWKGGSLHGAKMTNKMQKRLNQYFFISLV